MKDNNQSRWKKISKTLYNSETKTVLLRTPKQWGLLCLFYLVAYLFLSGFFFGMLFIFLYGYLDYSQPKLTGLQGILNLNPGLGYRPHLTYENTFLHVTTYPSQQNEAYIEVVDRMLKSYTTAPPSVNCSNPEVPLSVDRVCQFPIYTLGQCEKYEEQLKAGRPCVFIKINRMFGWLPDPLNSSIIPSPMIACKGQNPMDTVNLGTPVYYPSFISADNKTYGSIDNMYFPFLNQPGYQTPLVAVQFPEMVESTMVLVSCELVGMKYNQSVAFEFVVDSQKPRAM